MNRRKVVLTAGQARALEIMGRDYAEDPDVMMARFRDPARRACAYRAYNVLAEAVGAEPIQPKDKYHIYAGKLNRTS